MRTAIMRTVSKTTYLSFKTCPKFTWLYQNKRDEFVENPRAASQIQDGIAVGKAAHSYFANCFDATAKAKDGNLDLSQMIAKTKEAIKGHDVTIAEASFEIDGLFCSVDLLHPVEGGFEIVEVKATSQVNEEHLIDTAFQTHVLRKCGLTILGTYVLHLNNKYRRKGPLELDKLFIKERVDDDPLFVQTLREINDDVPRLRAILSSQTEPDEELDSKCKGCPFGDYCRRDLPTPSIVNLYKFPAYKHLSKDGIYTYQDLLKSGARINQRQRAQIESFLSKKEEIIDKGSLKGFLKKIRYPIYHLDFESVELPIPPVDNAWPYEQIPTQYSLHIEYKDGRLEHKEFLGETMDPRRAIAEALCRDIPEDGCVTAYNQTFEKTRLKELANLFPDLKGRLLKIRDNVVDLFEPFDKGYYYHSAMGGSASIKKVLPALYPNDPELDYHALPVVHNGSEAMSIYPIMVNAEPEEKEKIRKGLLDYCCLDTLAMVKVLKRIKEKAL